MNDIVEQARDRARFRDDLYAQLADEIVRLQAALKHIRDDIGPSHGEPRSAEAADIALRNTE